MSVPELTRDGARLAELEAVVERGLDTFVDVGLALRAIRDERLYLETHSTFESYLSERWGMSRRHGYRLIDGARVAELVGPIGHIARESQARELVPLLDDEAELIATVRELRSTYGEQITAKRIRRFVRGRLDRAQRSNGHAKRPVAPVEPVSVLGDTEIRHCDFRALTDLDGSADLVLSDPPYDLEWIEREGDDFGATAARMLKLNGALVVMCGSVTHYRMKAALDSSLRYRWTGALVMGGPRSRVFGSARVLAGWKPVLIFQRSDAEPPCFLRNDVFLPDGIGEKTLHGWQQSLSDFVRLVEAFSSPGDLIVDPFLGAGTTAEACIRTGRRFIGCDVDALAVQITRRRLDGSLGVAARTTTDS